MQYGGKYWNIKEYLPYQRCFNLINSERSIGKTYTTQGFLLEEALCKGLEFIYLVRTQSEKEGGVFAKAFAKVVQQEFKEETIVFSNDVCAQEIEVKSGEKEKKILGYCVALSEAVKFKKRNLPNVKYFVFDEYILEEKQSSSYVNGWNEPDLLLSIYHTVDRERDHVVCFLLANNITFYNPYHMHTAFSIPKTEKGEIWYNENVLFHWTEGTKALKEEKAKSKFLRMISETEYGKYAQKGDYVSDNVNFIAEKSPNSKHIFTFYYGNYTYGVWSDEKRGQIYISDKYDPSCPLSYALTLEDHKENTLLTRSKNSVLLNWLSKNFKLGNVRFTSMMVKVHAEKAIQLIL